jgi:hypothetical protein
MGYFDGLISGLCGGYGSYIYLGSSFIPQSQSTGLIYLPPCPPPTYSIPETQLPDTQVAEKVSEFKKLSNHQFHELLDEFNKICGQN